MKFTQIDISKWARAEMFYYFSKTAPTGYSVTTEINVTRLKSTLRDKDIKLFPAYLWLCTKNLGSQPEFTTAYKDDILGYYDALTPLYPCFHEDTKTVSLLWTEYSDSFPVFYERYLNDKAVYGNNHGILAKPNILPPENCYTVSCIPWLEFTHFSVHSYENKPYFFPSLEAGKITVRDGEYFMPLSITCHHAATDGYHVSEFIRSLQSDCDNFGEFL